MSACREVRTWFTENIRTPVERWVERAEESCTEARRWVEREVRRPIERERTRTEQRCAERPCNWWCACCNKWFCWLVTIVERIVEWIVEIVGEWLVELVCTIVVRLVRIVTHIVISVVRFVVVAVVCLFTEPMGALDALIDLWFDVVDLVSMVGDLIGRILDYVSDLLDIVREFLLDLADWLGPLGRIIIGLLVGIIDIVRRIVDGIRRIIDGIFDIVTGILRLDFCAALEGLVNGVGFGLGQAVFGVITVVGVGSGGARDAWNRDKLREWLDGRLAERFSGDRLAELRRSLAMDSASFGMLWPVQPIRCTISSRSDALDLRAMHQAGDVNLWEAAGYAPIGCKGAPVTRSNWRLVYPGTDYRVSAGELRAYLNDGRDAAPEFTLIAGEKRVFEETLVVARRKFRQLAIELDIDILRTFEVRTREEMFLPNTATPLVARIKDDLGLRELCDLPGVVVFGYDPRQFGLASVTWPEARENTPTGATVRSTFMMHLFGTVMAHEMGHCFGIKHDGHDGVHHIMWTADSREGLSTVTGETFLEYLLLGGEPGFTLQDGKDAWGWITDKAAGCL